MLNRFHYVQTDCSIKDVLEDKLLKLVCNHVTNT